MPSKGNFRYTKSLELDQETRIQRQMSHQLLQQGEGAAGQFPAVELITLG